MPKEVARVRRGSDTGFDQCTLTSDKLVHLRLELEILVLIGIRGEIREQIEKPADVINETGDRRGPFSRERQVVIIRIQVMSQIANDLGPWYNGKLVTDRLIVCSRRVAWSMTRVMSLDEGADAECNSKMIRLDW